jgi:hypothetical protein
MKHAFRVVWGVVPAALAVLVWAAGGCSGSALSEVTPGIEAGTSTGGNEGGGGNIFILVEAGVPCAPPGAKNCVTDTLARICPSDGSGWLPVECRAGEKCESGDCKPDPNASCTPGDGSCLTDATGLRCKDDGQGFANVTCPPNTKCTGKGVCRGSCVVGDTFCATTSTVISCADGNSYTQAKCPAGQLCVDTTAITPGAPARSAACVASECTPDPYGCNTACGDKSDATQDQTKFTSTCIATPEGYKWLASPCAAGQTCDPAGGYCGGYHMQAACSGTCTPGSMRCSSDGMGSQTCGQDGKWGAITPCNGSPTAAQYVCMTSPVDPTLTVCGDLLCRVSPSYYKGICDANGNFHACGNDGRIATTGYACNNGGICVQQSSTSFNGYTPGACAVACQAGDQKCTASSSTSYEVCNSGQWSAPIECPTAADGGANHCFPYTTAAPGLRPATICGGVCVPGSHQCASVSDGAASNDGIQTCSSSGTWGAAQACTLGACAYANGDYACRTQCIPGSTVCVGALAPATGTGVPQGTLAAVTCEATGQLPPVPNCAVDAGGAGCCSAGTSCRRSSTGVATGCVQCVGSAVTGGNEYGAVDSRCAADDGGVGIFPDAAAVSSGVESCTATNQWPAQPQDDCPSGTSCTSPQRYCGGYCYVDLGPPSYNYAYVYPCTDSNIKLKAGSNFGCSSLYGYVYGYLPGQCGATPDCCEYSGNPNYSYCYATSSPNGIAYCQ